MPWWSLTKTAIAAAVLRLAEDGALDLDAPIERYGSIRHLLAHTGGAPDYGGLPAYHQAVAAGERAWPVSELLGRVGEEPLFAPGEGWGYSNIGYLRLRQIIEATTGGPLGQALSDLVFRPLGVAASLVDTPEAAERLAGVMPGYDPAWVYHGLLAGSLGSAALFVQGLASGRLLKAETLKIMASGRPLTVDVGDRPWERPAYGFGVMTGRALGRDVVGHTGGGPDSVIAVYSTGERAAAAFLAGHHAAVVERAAIGALAE